MSTTVPIKSSIWLKLKDALRGTEADYTQISLKHAIFLLSVPMILELVMESTFAIVDIYFVSKLGPSAVAAVGLTETYLFLIYSIAMGLSVAVTALVARRIGEKKKEEAGELAVQSIFLAIISAIPFTLAGIFYAPELMKLMGADSWIMQEGYRYTQWMLGGNLIVMLIFVINAIFRGAGDAAIAMRVLWISNGINIILDPILILGWGPVQGMGVEGAAIATNIGRGIGVLMQIYVLFKGGKHIRLKLKQLVWNARAMSSIVKTSLGGIGQMIISMTSWVFLVRILADIGSEAVAASTTVIRLMMLTLMPAWGLSNAAATLVGQNLGAQNTDRAEQAVWKIGTYNMIYLIIVSILYYSFDEFLMRIFTDSPTVVSIGAEWIRILSYSYFIYGWWMVSVQAFNGAGDTRTPTLINIVFFWMIQIPLSYYLAIHLNWQHSGVFWAVFVSETMVGIFTLWLFKRGSWKKVEL